MVAFVLTPEQQDALIAKGRGDLVRKYRDALTPLELFEPRPDCPEEFDQQTAFVESKAKFSILLGGTGAGKSIAAAYKTARYLLNTEPLEERWPFWVIGMTFELCCGVCWQQKLSKFIPPQSILAIDSYKPSRNWPRAVILRHPKDRNKPGWSIEFKSAEQGVDLLQGIEIGGYWLNEQIALNDVREVQWRTRKTGAPGWADFTPMHMVMSEWEEKYRNPPEGWQFFHVNAQRNVHINQDFVRMQLADTPEGELETRRIGKFGSYHGIVFKEFNRAIHVIDELPQTNLQLIDGIPSMWKRMRGIDPAFNAPFACMWVCKDNDERYYVYDEVFETQKRTDQIVDLINSRPWRARHPLYGRTFIDDADPRLIADLQHLGIANVSRAQKDLINPRVSMLRSLMMVRGDGRPRLYIHSRCKNLIRELQSYHWPEGTGEGITRRNPKETPVDADNHCIDAMGYAIWGDKKSLAKPPESIRREWKPAEGVQVQLNGRNGNGRH